MRRGGRATNALRPRTLAGAAALLGALALAAGEPVRGGGVPLHRLAAAVEAEEDHVSAVLLAQWIRARRADLEVVDLRAPDAYADYHVPTAVNRALEELVARPPARDRTVVLYSEGGTHAAQAWLLLAAGGHPHVYFLREGLYEWLDQVISPALAPATDEAGAAALEARLELSRYFGGTPRLQAGADGPRSDALAVPEQGPAHDAGTAAGAVRRRGC